MRLLDDTIPTEQGHQRTAHRCNELFLSACAHRERLGFHGDRAARLDDAAEKAEPLAACGCEKVRLELDREDRGLPRA